MQNDFLVRHSEFVLGLAKKDDKLHDLIGDHWRLYSYVTSRLEALKAMPGLENMPNSEISECGKLRDYQLAKLVWLLDSLQMSSNFRKRIGAEIEADLKDEKSAHGGVIVFQKDELGVIMIPGKALGPAASGAGKKFEHFSYEPIDFAMKPEFMFLFHFHAFEEDSSKFASPTGSDLKDAERRGFDGIVFTKLIGKHFNADFYFAGKDVDDNPFRLVLDLGVYGY